MKKAYLLPVLAVTVLVGVVTLISSCDSGSSSANLPPAGFSAEIKPNGIVFADGEACVQDPLDYAYIQVYSKSAETAISFGFASIGSNGIGGMSPGVLDTFDEPHINIGGFGWGYLGTRGTDNEDLTGDGEILAISADRVAGTFNVEAKDGSWTLVNGSFNLPLVTDEDCLDRHQDWF